MSPFKILHVIPSLEIGGAQRLVISVCKELQNKGFNVKIIVFKNDNQYNNESKDLNIELIELTYKTKFFQRFYSDNFILLTDAINTFNPDIIHTHLFQADFLCRIKLHYRAKYFSHFHDHSYLIRYLTFNWFSKKELVKLHDLFFLEKLFKNSKNTFLSISSEIDNFYSSKANRISLKMKKIYNCVDNIRFNVENIREIDKKVKLVNCARNIKIKNQDFLIDLMNLIVKKHKLENFELTILGNGVLHEDLKKRIKFLKLEKYIVLPGSVSNVEDYYKSAHIYVHSALDGVFGISTLEAIASGLPIVGFKGNSNDEVVINRKNALLVENNNINLFKNSIFELINDKRLYEIISNNNIKKGKLYSTTNYVKKLLEIYFE